MSSWALYNVVGWFVYLIYYEPTSNTVRSTLRRFLSTEAARTDTVCGQRPKNANRPERVQQVVFFVYYLFIIRALYDGSCLILKWKS